MTALEQRRRERLPRTRSPARSVPRSPRSCRSTSRRRSRRSRTRPAPPAPTRPSPTSRTRCTRCAAAGADLRASRLQPAGRVVARAVRARRDPGARLLPGDPPERRHARQVSISLDGLGSAAMGAIRGEFMGVPIIATATTPRPTPPPTSSASWACPRPSASRRPRRRRSSWRTGCSAAASTWSAARFTAWASSGRLWPEDRDRRVIHQGDDGATRCRRPPLVPGEPMEPPISCGR